MTIPAILVGFLALGFFLIVLSDFRRVKQARQVLANIKGRGHWIITVPDGKTEWVPGRIKNPYDAKEWEAELRRTGEIK